MANDNIPLLGQNKNIWHTNIFDPQPVVPENLPILESRRAPVDYTWGATTPVSTNRGGNIIQNMLGNGQSMADLGNVISGFGVGEKADRVIRGNYTQDYDKMLMDREAAFNDAMLRAQTGRNDNETDALKKLQQTAYIGGGGNALGPISIMLGGTSRSIPTYGLGPAATTAEEQTGAKSLQEMLMNRLKSGGSYLPTQNVQPHPLESYARPGMAENISSYAGTGAGIIGALGGLLGQGSSGTAGTGGVISNLLRMLGRGGGGSGTGTAAGTASGGLMSKIMGNAVPIAGAVTGGLGLMKDRGLGSNILSGATTGASIGSMVPGLGTLIGGGIGAGVGALRGLGGGPSDIEKAGRITASHGRQALVSTATPEQQAEAQKSGWSNPNDALALIVVRDAMVKQGKSPDAANVVIHQLHSAEKQGPEAVQAVLQQIMGAAGPRVPSSGPVANTPRPQGW